MNKISWNVKLVTILIVVAIIPATIIVINILGIIQDELKSTVNQELIFTSNEIAQQIDEEYQKTFEIFELANIYLTEENLSSQEKINLLISIIKTVDNILGITITYEPKGSSAEDIISIFKDSILTKGEKIELEKLNNAEDTLQKTFNKNYLFSRLKYISSIDLWYQTLRADIRNDDDFYLNVYFNVNSIINYIESHPLQKKGKIFLIDLKGNKIYSSNDTNTDYDFLSKDGVKIASSNKTFSIVNNYKSNSNKEVVACFTSVQNIPWVIITGIKKDDAYAVVSEIMNIFIWWILVSLLAAITISYLFSEKISEPIKNMAYAADEIAKGNFNTVVNYSANDSIGLLGQSLIKMSNELDQNFKDINRQKLELEDYSKNLEKKVEQRTADLVKANEEINRSYQKVLELIKEKNEFLGIAAHDLKNPLASIKGFTNILLEDLELPAEIRKDFLKDIMGASNRMFDIVTNLLDVNAIEEGKVKIKIESTSLELIINHIVHSNNELASKKEIKIITQADAPNIFVKVDKNITLQIIDNLVSNAIKFSPPGKNVYIFYRDNIDNNSVLVYVKDEGPGFTEEDKKKVFGKFARLSAKPTAGENSTGLGLSIVKKLVELQGAKISLESEFGNGAIFILELPKGEIYEENS